MALTQTKISRLTPTADCTPSRPDRYADVEGLYLFVRHTGNKVFYSRYRLNGKRVELKIGNYPAMTLQQARKRNLEIQQMAKSGTDPKQHKQKENDKPVFDDIANEWFTKVHKKKTVTGTYNRDYSQYTRDIKPLLGNLYLDEITAPQVLEVAIQIEKRGATDMSKRALGKVSEIYGYAKEKGYTDKNPAEGLTKSKSLAKHKVKHHAKVDIKQLPKLLQDINNYSGHVLVKYGLWFMAYTFLRTKNIRFLEWSEVDFDNQTLSIPAHKMKADKPHTAPLAPQSIEILQTIKDMGLSDRYVFFNIYKQQPYSENAFTNALNSMGYKGEMTGHGFRGLASTILNNYGFNKDVIETELSHSDKDNVRSSYNHADYMDMRVDMVNKWALFLESAGKGKIEKIAPSMVNISPHVLIGDLLSVYSKQQLIQMIEDY